jgi:hypothetical protein
VINILFPKLTLCLVMQRIEIQEKHKEQKGLNDWKTKITVWSCNNYSLIYPIGPPINCSTVADQLTDY